MPQLTEKLEAMLARGDDSATLRFAIGSAHLGAGEWQQAITHLRVAVDLDPDYSAAWKQLGKALRDAGHSAEALAAFRAGIEVAERHGDMQALKEMTVFARRLEAQQSSDTG